MHTFGFVRPALAGLVILLLGSTAASAQPGAQPPPPPSTTPGYYAAPPPAASPYGSGYVYRRGLTVGLSLGVGAMETDSGLLEACRDCDYEPISGGGAFHIGAMLNPRLAILFELWGTVQTIDAVGATSLVQSMAMIAAQYWVAPRFWLKGGIGVANLGVQWDDGYGYGEQDLGQGGAVMGAVGYEILTAPRFSIDLQARLGVGTYEDIGEQVYSSSFGAGINWY